MNKLIKEQCSVHKPLARKSTSVWIEDLNSVYIINDEGPTNIKPPMTGNLNDLYTGNLNVLRFYT